MKNKKQRTIEDIILNHNVLDDWEEMYTEIKQLIADEVIKNTTVELRELLNSRRGADITDTTASICEFFEKEQLKKLERL